MIDRNRSPEIAQRRNRSRNRTSGSSYVVLACVTPAFTDKAEVMTTESDFCG
jgi:hypothetical protein